MTPETKALADALLVTFKDLTARLAARIDHLEARPLPEAIKGEAGPEGPQGDRGEPGEPGQPGQSVTLEAIALLVAGEVAKQLALIPKPADGRNGEDGRDAVDIDILPAIDITKRYHRGTWASHDGGLWRAKSNTDGMHGWECVVDGVKEITFDTAERGGAVNVTTSAGIVKQHAFAFPAMIYRGIFKEGSAYEPGDTVTWGGSLWHCKAATTTKPDTADSGWQLAAKRGRDGKDGTHGRDLVSPVQLREAA